MDPGVFGTEIPLSRAEQLLTACSCPGPTEGEAAGDIVRSWESGSNFGFVFADGKLATYRPSEASPEEFIKEIETSLASPDESGPIGELLDFRGTRAWVKEVDAHGPAFIEWVEGSTNITYVGASGEPLSELIEFVGALTKVTESGS